MSTIRQAACVILLRPSSTPTEPYELLLVRRSAQLNFLGGFDAFPGGSVDPVDVALALPLDDGARRSAALRELFEETGILPTSPQLTPAQATQSRQALHESSAHWQHVVASTSGNGSATHLAEQLLFMGHWVTPPYTSTLFDAFYYALWVSPDVGVHLDGSELVDYCWHSPKSALQAHEAGELFITYPVLETLRTMAQFGADLSGASKAMAERGKNPHPHGGGEMLDGVHVVPVRTPTLPPATHTNTYVLGHDRLVVVDPATPYPEEQDRLVGYLRHLESEGAKVTEIWLTHHHHDHIGAVNRVRQEFGVGVAAHPITAELLAGTIEVHRLCSDGEIRTLPRRHGPAAQWQALHTPGHTRGHLCFFDTTRGTLLSGDLILGAGTVLVAPPEGNMQAYMHSLARLRHMPLGFLFPAHGPPVAAAKEKIDMYIAHRSRRERAILSTLTQPRQPPEIVSLVYTDIDPKAYPLAELNIQAHLEKLVAEGLVQLQPQGYERCRERQ